jgi:hypothetical protein
MVTNPKHVSEGRVNFTLKSGTKVRATLLHNDPVGETFWIEPHEGFFKSIPYAQFASASIQLSR